MEPIQISTSRATVLLVDDEAVLRRLLSRMLAEAGFGVVDAEDGQRALEVARAFDGTLALVVTDLHMPVMSGLEFAQAFRPLHPSVPILFISGRDLPEKPAASDRWEEDILRKPFGAEVFLDAVTRLLNATSVARAP